MLTNSIVTRIAKVALLLSVLASNGSAYAQVALNLSQGWNLLGNSSAAPMDVAVTFGDAGKITTVWKWNKVASKWAFYAPSMDPSALTIYAQGKGYDVLASVDPKEGFWVNASTAVALTGPVASGVALVESDLQPGWNLVGSADNATPPQLNQSLGGSLNAAGKAMVTAWAWDAPYTKWRFYAPALDAKGATALADYVTSRGYLPFGTALTAADGFWLNIGSVTPTPATIDFPVNELFAAALIAKGMPADFARFFAAAKWTFNCPGDATCAYLQTYSNGATRQVSVTATPNQQYTVTTADYARNVLVSNPVYDGKFAAVGIDDTLTPIDTNIDISFFVPTTSIPASPTTLSSALSSAISATATVVSNAQTGSPGVTDGVRISWIEIGKKGVDASIGGALDHYELEKTGNIYKVASVASDLATAMKLRLETNAWLAELDELEKCAANPNQLSQTDPTYSATTVARLKSIRAEIMANSSVRLLNLVDETAEGFVPKESSTVMAVLSIPMKQGHEYTEQTLKDVSTELMREARNSVTSCIPTCPTNLAATAVSETQIDVSWSGSVGTNVATGYNIAHGGTNVNSTATAWSDTGLTPSRTYCYTVSTYNEFGTSANCPQACATTLGPPVVHGTNPFGGEMNVNVKSAITVTFSEAMDATTITTGTVIVSSPVGSVAGTVTYGGLTATFTPSADLAYATTYTATITSGTKDLDGTAMAANYTWSFTTEPAPTAGNFHFVQTGTDGAVVNGNANITWNLRENLGDLNTYYPTGTMTADITPANCDTVHVSKAIGPTTETTLDGGRLVVYNNTNTVFPMQYEFALISVLWAQTFQCGDPRTPVTISSFGMAVDVGLCIPPMSYPRYTDAAILAGTWSCPLSIGAYIGGKLDATWDFTNAK